MSQIKIPLIVFIAVFLTSGLLAIFSGSSYLVIIFKAIVSAVVVATFVFVAKFLLQKYVPDMFENAKDPEEADAPTVGTNIDVRIGNEEASQGNTNSAVAQSSSITSEDMDSMEGLADDAIEQEDVLKDVEMEAPNFQPMNFKSSRDGEVTAGKEESTPNETDNNPVTENEKKTQNENAINGEEVKETPVAKQENVQFLPTLSNKNDTEAENKDAQDSLAKQVSVPQSQNIPEKKVDDETELSEAEMTQAMQKDVDRLEELPDLQEFVEGSQLAKQSKAEELMSAGTQSFFETNLAEDVGADSKLMANAIRTVLKRE